MTDAAAPATAFHIVSEAPGPRFLGLRAAERNARVARRATNAIRTAGMRDPPVPSAATLRVPAGVVITGGLLAALPPRGLWHLVWDTDHPPIVWQTGDASATAATLHLPPGAAFDVSTAAARRHSAWEMLRRSGKATDGWLARHVHRKVSRICSYLLLRLGLTANHATFLTLLVGIAAAWLMANTTQATMIAGALLFWFASIADGIDGEMARLTLSESAYGEQLDTAVDHATHLLGFGGVMVGWWRQGIGPGGWLLATAVAAGLPGALLYGMYLVRRARRTPNRFFVDTKPIELAVTDAAEETGAAALRLASAVFVLFRRESFSLTFVLVSLVIGRRAVYPALLAAGLAVVALTLIGYREPIERALLNRSRRPASST